MMNIFIVDLGFIAWWHRKLWGYAISWRAGWPTSMEYGEVSWINLDMRPFDPWKIIEGVRDIYLGPIVREPPFWSSGS